MTIKNILLPIVTIAAVLTSCGPTQEDLISEVVQNKMKDPSSYELVSVNFEDTVTLSDHYAELIAYCDLQSNKEIGEARELLERGKMFSSSRMIQRYLDESKIHAEVAQSWIDKSKEFTKLREGVMNTPQDTVRELRYTVKCYGNNSYGARILNDVDVKVLPNGEIKL